MLVTCSCSKCAEPIGIVQYTHHYYCNNDYGAYVCVKCYNAGQKKCEKCEASLRYHNPDDTIKWQKENNILF